MSIDADMEGGALEHVSEEVEVRFGDVHAAEGVEEGVVGEFVEGLGPVEKNHRKASL